MKKHFPKWAAITLIIIAGLLAALVLEVWIAQLSMRSCIRKVQPVAYENQLKPSLAGDHVSFTTDGDFRIMQVNDIHLCSSIFSIRRDRKTIYELVTMIQAEKPDFVVICGDSIYPMWGYTLNNRMLARDIILLFDQLQVYWTIAFGNHETESFDFFSRKSIGRLFEKQGGPYCVFRSEFDAYGVSNQCILVNNSDGSVRKALMVLDSNSYIDGRMSSSFKCKYDTIHDNQVMWAADTIKTLSANGPVVKSLCFFHIPTGEYASAYRQLEANGFEDTADTKYISGFWDEKFSDLVGGRICYGGCANGMDPDDADILLETLGPEGLGSLEACFVGHDHTNTAVVDYKGVILAYGCSLDNSAYVGLARYGKQRGAMVVTIHNDGDFDIVHKNAYLDYGVDPTAFIPVNLDEHYKEGAAP